MQQQTIGHFIRRLGLVQLSGGGTIKNAQERKVNVNERVLTECSVLFATRLWKLHCPCIMFCSNCGYCLQESFSYCPKCGSGVNSGKNQKKHAAVGTASVSRPSNTTSSESSPMNPAPSRSIPNFSTFMKEKEADRQAHFQPKRKKSHSSSATVKDESVFINIGLMEYEAGEPKRVYGKSFPVKVLKDMNYDEVRGKAIAKWEDYDNNR